MSNTYFWKIGHIKADGKLEDCTARCAFPIFIEDRLDETLGTAQITLDMMPLDTRDKFPPKCKFKIARHVKQDYSDTPTTWSYVVEHDDVEVYVGVPDYCCHRIHLIEPSVVAQGMHVDNIALTYELHDVDMNYKTVSDKPDAINDNIVYINDSRDANHNYSVTTYISHTSSTISQTKLTGSFNNSYQYVWDTTSFESIQKLKLLVHSNMENEISFTVPKLYIEGCYDNSRFKRLFELNTITTVTEVLFKNNIEISRTKKIIKNCGPTSLPDKNDDVFYSDKESARLRMLTPFKSDKNIDKHDLRDGKYKEFYAVSAVTASVNKESKTINFKTLSLSQSDSNDGYTVKYEIECKIDDTYSNGYITQLNYNYKYDYYRSGLTLNCNAELSEQTNIKLKKEKVSFKTSFNCTDNSVDVQGGLFIIKGSKYSCYDLLRKALLTCDTHVINNDATGLDEYDGDGNKNNSLQHSIIVDPEWNNRLKTTKAHETVFEGKNLWEVLLQIGSYMHAIPKLVFAADNDRYMLTFRQLGNSKVDEDTSGKLTVFNSKNISDYFTQYDSYVSNLFSPQNSIEEWVVPKTSDSSYLVCNDNAEIHLKYPITEIVALDIIHDGLRKSALDFIFEKSIYDILTNNDPAKISPAKGNSLFYTLGDSKIHGLNYVAPSATGTNLMSLKYIMQKLFGIQSSMWTNEFTFNNLSFYIKYRTQDNMRLTQFRPDIQNFVKNTSIEQYPHHEQYYGQQDKIVDSERFSANLWGKLIRVGNNIMQCQEYVRIGKEKVVGQLINLCGAKYYVTAIENEYYGNLVLQKVTYSKNFNQVASIVTIPSEPRFYEVSERSKIRREVRLMDFLTLSIIEPEGAIKSPKFMDSNWITFAEELIFKSNRSLPNYAWTRFMVDRKRKHYSAKDQVIDNKLMFPSSEVERQTDNSIKPKSPSDHADCIVPLLHYPLHDGILFEWDMEDNFKCGDMIDNSLSGSNNTQDGAYLSMQPMRYADVMGRADLMQFKLFNKTDWTYQQQQKLPKSELEPSTITAPISVQGGDTYAVALEKDNREALSFNYQINLLHRAEKGEDFVTFPNMFGAKDGDLIACLHKNTVAIFDEYINISPDNSSDITYTISNNNGCLKISFTNPDNWASIADDYQSIVFYQQSDNSKVPYFARNIGNTDVSKQLGSWWIYPVYND